MGDPNSETADSPYVACGPQGDFLGPEDVSRMLKAYLDRLRKEREAIGNSL